MIFDSHAHYDDAAFDSDREELLESFPGKGIKYVVNAGSSFESLHKTERLMERYPFLYGAFGIHPENASELNDEVMEWLKERLKRPKAVAVGEIGLDYYWDEPDRTIQKECFSKQLQLAKKTGKPVIIHSRDAAKDTLDILTSEHGKDLRGVIHCFSYTKETARDYLNLGYYFGIGGVVTFKNAKKLKEAVEYIPLNSILIETDCPYLAPEPNRGKRNSSLNLSYIIAQIAKLKGISEQEVEEATFCNAVSLFGIR